MPDSAASLLCLRSCGCISGVVRCAEILDGCSLRRPDCGRDLGPGAGRCLLLPTVVESHPGPRHRRGHRNRRRRRPKTARARTFNLVICDLLMPDLDGFDVIAALCSKRRRPHLKAVGRRTQQVTDVPHYGS